MPVARFFFISLLLFSSGFTQTFVEQGRFGQKGRLPGQFNNPQAIAVANDGTLYVVDTENHRIQLFNLRGEFIKTIGGFGFKKDQFDSPRDIWVNSLINIYVSDFNNRRIQRFDKDMNFLNSFINNEGEEPDFQFGEVSSCLLSTQNDLFILDNREFKIVKYSRDGRSERMFRNIKSGYGELQGPEQLELLSFDKILVSDPEAKALIVFDLFGNYINTFTNAAFKYPRGIEVDNKNRIYIADPDAQKIFIKNDPQPFKEIRSAFGFKFPRDVAVFLKDDTCYLYVLDGNEVIIGTIIFDNADSE
jgi:hypothetical protein